MLRLAQRKSFFEKVVVGVWANLSNFVELDCAEWSGINGYILKTKVMIHSLLLKYYPADTALRRILLHHSRQVVERALLIAERHPELRLNKALLEEGAWVHDIGVFLTDAPGIECHGTHPYLLHGALGAELMRKEGREDLARFCERHTGTGLTVENIRAQNLPLPLRDYRPETMEEKVVCYADKFYSKSHLERVRTVEQTAQSLEKFGAEGVATFRAWAQLFE